MSGRSLTAITSVGSTKKESSEAQQPPADRGKTKLLLSFIYSVNKIYFNYNFQAQYRSFVDVLGSFRGAKTSYLYLYRRSSEVGSL